MKNGARNKFPQKTPEEYLLEEEELSSNSETRVPIILCVDCSFSMRQQRRLEKVLEGLQKFLREMAADLIACQSVELCLISFGGDQAIVERDFTPPDRLEIPHLTADGGTPLADAVMTALENLEKRKIRYDDNGNSYYRPWLILVGDGDESGSSQALDQAAAVLKAESDAKHLSVLCVTVGDEDKIECSSLMKLAPDGKVQYLRDLKFGEFFSWLSRSIQKTSQSMSGEEVYFAPTTSWGEVLERK